MTYYGVLQDRAPERILPHSNRPDADRSGRFVDGGIVPNDQPGWSLSHWGVERGVCRGEERVENKDV